MARSKLVGTLRLVSRERISDGYTDFLEVTRSEGDLQYGNDFYKGGIMHGVIEYKGKRRSKSFRGETAHSDLERWISDTIVPVIHAGKGI